MPPGITEFAYVTLKEDAARDALDPDTEAGKAVEYMIDQVLRHPGAHHAHWSMAIERPNQLWVFVDWDKVQDHLDYRETEAYADVQKKLLPLVDLSNPTSISHIDPAVSSVFAEPSYSVVEVLSKCFPSDIDEATKKAAETQWNEFVEKALLGPGMCKAVTIGWSVEKDVALIGEEGKTCSVLLSLISWTSVEQHMKNREEEVFQKNRHLLTGLPSLVKLDMFHMKAKSRLAKDVSKLEGDKH